uniref:Uncharacterized protein n=1 Tax=Fundulus heteroclitus TaxID=8078 RepID=A0A3Q2P9V1_FUNHE
MAKRLSTAPLSARKLRNTMLSPEYRAEQFPRDFYVSGELLFCKFCQYSIDRNKATTSLQTCLTAAFKSSDLRKEFVEDFVAMRAEADIPLKKMTKLHPFLKKHCKQGGALPENVSSLRQLYLPRMQLLNSFPSNTSLPPQQ